MNIIFVDDEVNLLQSLKRSLRPFSNEWQMEFVENGPEALKIMSKTIFNIIVADYKMPVMNGLELLKKVKEKYPAIKRILLTGQSETEVYEEAKNLVDKYIAKPCDHDELISILKKI